MPVLIRRMGVKTAPGALRRDGTRILAGLGRDHAELSVVLCDDAFIRDLNKEWRGVDGATDVLSFEMGGDVLGDVVLSVETASRQAAEHGHSLGHELRILLVHGVLHLVGHDHIESEAAARMRAEEARLLALWAHPGAGLIDRATAAG